MTVKSFKVVKKIVKKGWPTSSSMYREAHSEASTAEKKKFPKGYVKLKKLDAKTPEGVLIGKNFKNGKIEVSKVVPKRLRKEVAFHEATESKALKRLTKRKKK